MKLRQLMKREDGQLFEVVEIGHWSLVIAKGLDASEDRVKWIGGTQFVGAYSEKSYTLLDDNKVPVAP